MGAFDWVGDTLDWLGKRWSEDWADFRKTGKETWGALPGHFMNVAKGVFGMATAPLRDDAEFLGSARLWADSAVGVGSSLLGGTLGTLFQVPVLHEVGWLLDKAYRYGVARPISTSFLWLSNGSREAYRQGESNWGGLADQLGDFNTLQKAWNDSAYVTPGQAIVYGGTLYTQSRSDLDGAMRWADEHDPRTRAGQATFNSKEASFWLKYGSGSLDFVLNLAADPGHGATALTKLARVRFLDKPATSKYVLAGKVEKELTTGRADKVFETANEAASPEQLRVMAMPDWVHGSEAADLLWTAARMGRTVFNDTWLVLRANDQKAFARLTDLAPKIAADFGDTYARFTIADMDYQRGNLHAAKQGADPLVKAKVAAFADSMVAGEGVWGSAPGIGVGEAMPRVGLTAKMRAGYHDHILHRAPVVIARTLQNLMPTQGFTRMINASDNTAIGVRQFKANIERANTMGEFDSLGNRQLLITPAEIDKWVSAYGRAQSDASRAQIAALVDDKLVTLTFERWGFNKKDIPRMLEELNRTRRGTRAFITSNRIYMTGELRAAAQRARKLAQGERAAQLDQLATEHAALAKQGVLPENYFASHGADGSLHLTPLDGELPVLRSQFTEAITMTDLRQLNGALRWHSWMHPTPKRVLDPETGVSQPGQMSSWQTAFGQAAKARGWYDRAVDAADFTSMLWKSMVLGRAGQAVRGVASDWAHMVTHMGKLEMLKSSAMIVPSALRNIKRGKLAYEALGEKLALARAGGQRPIATATQAGPVVSGNVSQYTQGSYPTWRAMFADGAMPLKEYLSTMERLHKSGATKGRGPYFAERVYWERRRTTGRDKTKRAAARLQYQRDMTAHALQDAGKAAFTRDSWGEQVLGDLVQRHIDRATLPGYKDNPYAPGTMIVDPFMGTVPKLADETPNAKLHEVFDISGKTVLSTKNVMGPYRKDVTPAETVDIAMTHELLKRWIVDNADELLKPDAHLALRVKPNGHIAVGVAKAKKDVAASGKVTKLNSATMQLRDFPRQGIDDSAHRGHTLKDKKGNVVADFEGGLSGKQGNLYQSMISARENPVTGSGNLVEDWAVARQIRSGSAWKAIKPTDREHAGSWERAVNAQIANDPVMRAFIERKSDGSYRTVDEVISLVEDTAWGTKWIHSMKHHGAGYAGHIEDIRLMVDQLLPLPDGRAVPDTRMALAHEARADALNHQARYAQLEGLFYKDGDPGWRENMPAVHGAQLDYAAGKGPFFDRVMGFLRGFQKFTSDMPVDKWARFPFFASVYKKHSTELAKIAAAHFDDGPIPAKVKDTIQSMAREKAYHDVRFRLYDTAQRNDFAYATRFLMPFSAAMMDSYIKFGRSVRENPMLLVQGAYYWDAFERNNMIQDENGNTLVIEPDGTRAWYQVDPKTGAKTRVPADQVGKHEYVQFVLPSALSKLVGKKFYGVDAHPVFSINKQNLNVFLNLPSGGPLVAFPANEFALSNPEFGENAMVRKYLLPYGPTAQSGRTFLPPTIRALWDAFVGEEGATAEANAKAIMQAELTAFGLGTRTDPPTFAEAREKAAGLVFLRFATAVLSPASFQVQSPYKPYIDAYHQLRSNPAVVNAEEEFMRRYGDEFWAMTMSVTRNNAGLSATLESSKAYDKYRDLIAAFPEFGGLIVGSEGVGVFAKSVYEQQKNMTVGPGDNRTLREMVSLQDSVSDSQKRAVWAEYSKLMDLIKAAMVDRGLRSLRGRGAKDLVAAKEAFVAKHQFWDDPASGQRMLSPWFVDYRNSDAGNAQQKLMALRTIASDPQLSKRDDMRGLLEYFEMRDQMQTVMARRGFKTLESMQASKLHDQWQRQVHRLVEENTAFAAVWNRWLSNDEKLDTPAYGPGR